MFTTRLTAMTIIAVLAAAVAVFYGSGLNQPDAATARARILGPGKAACFEDARADSRNLLIPSAKLTAFCSCVMDRAVGALSDAELQTAIGGASAADRMPMKLQAANTACKGTLLD